MICVVLVVDIMLICPKCGAHENQKQFLESFCVDCYPIRIQTPTKFQVRVCKQCDRMLCAGEWVPYSEERLDKMIKSKTKGSISAVRYDHVQRKLCITIKTPSGDEKTIWEPLALEFDRNSCPTCSRKSGGYFEAIVQIRGDPKKVAMASKAWERDLSAVTYVSKSEEKKEGVDLYVGNMKAALAFIETKGNRVIITRKLFGEREGKRIFRTTFAVWLGEKQNRKARIEIKRD